MAVMKAMGMESDQEVVQMVGRDPRYSALLLPSIEVIMSRIAPHYLISIEYLHRTIRSWFNLPDQWREILSKQIKDRCKANLSRTRGPPKSKREIRK